MNNLPRFSSIGCWLGILLVIAVESAYSASALDAPANFPTTPKASQHGPQRTDPSQSVPKHAYSPFDKNTTTPARKLIVGRDFVADRIVIKFRPEIQAVQGLRAAKTSNGTLNQTLADLGVTELEPVFPIRDRVAVQKLARAGGAQAVEPDLSRWHRAGLSKGVQAEEVAAKLRVDPTVEYAEPDYLRRLAGDSSSLNADRSGNSSDVKSTPRAASLSTQSISGGTLIQASARGPTPNLQGLSAAGAGSQTLPGSGTDPKYNDQWHLTATKVPEAWASLQSQGLPPGGNRDNIIAVIDTGVDYTHPDLAANIWTNAGEIPGNGIDDDRNGFVDDVHGIDLISKSGNPMDDHGHGTHVAGIIAAQGKNNLGGVGVAYNCQIMAIKAAQYSGALSTSDIAKAINYAVAQGADVINMSFGGYARSQIEEDALAVAFGQAVLVAAAGNDGKPNEVLFDANPMYPAAYNWVLGVMARTERPNSKGDFLAGFSNFDVFPQTTVEYELMAPGVDVWSILPNGQYAAWDGTSMSAPLVAGVAALVRTVFKDKDLYSSRFIMGQIATTGALLQGRTLPDGRLRFYNSLDASAALTTFPKPNLSYLEHWVFDTKSQSAINDNDGIVDSGETIDLAVVIRNHWGKADSVTVKLEPLAEQAFQPDPYVTMITDVVDYGAIGSFSQDDNGLIYDAQKTITGVRTPFRFRVSSNCPNEHVIPFRVTMSARNGLDSRDSQTYASTSRFTLVVQRGRELPRIISENMILSKDFLWIISGQTLIQSNATVLVTQGAQLQFGSPASASVYSQVSDPYLQVEGTLRIVGTFDEPVELFPSNSGSFPRVQIRNFGTTTISYVKVLNPMLGSGFSGFFPKCPINSVDHLYGVTDGRIKISTGLDPFQAWRIGSLHLEKSILHRMDGEGNGHHAFLSGPTNVTEVLFDGLRVNNANNSLIRLGFVDGPWGIGTLQNSVVLQDNFSNVRTVVVPWIYNPTFPSTANTNNAFLSKLWDPDSSHWIGVDGSVLPRGETFSLANNFWGTTNSGLLEKLIYDASDNFNIGAITYEPALRVAPSSTYPFVVDVKLSNASHDNLAIVGAESVTYSVTFNRDMSTKSQPQVSFGPDTPATDYSVHPVGGGWRDARTWTGTFNITPATGDGYQLIRVAGAVAADDPWLVTGDDAGRFRFEIITSGTESMNLQATGGEGRVDLSWTQNDFELLAGFSLYRSTNPTNNFSRLNTSLIPPDKRSFRDSNVQPGVPYYYRFTVVKTDLAESDFSNVSTATPLDTIPPVVTHTPVTGASAGLSRSLFADVADNAGVQSVTLYFRPIAMSAYSSRAMTFTTGNRFAVTLEGSRLVSPGLEYYIEATDGVSTTRAGNAGLPYQMRVEDRPTVTSVSPVRGPASGGTVATVSGSNFKPGATVTFGSASASNVSVVSSSQITCVTPASFPSTVDVIVRNADGQSGGLLRAFIFQSDVISLSLPSTGGGQGSIVQVPVTAANLDGLAAAGLTVTFESAVIRALGARTGTLTPGWGIAANTNTAGQIRLSMASPGGLVSGSGTLALIEFEVIGASGAKSSMRLSNVSLNDGAIRSEAADGSFAVNLTYDVRGTVRHWNGDAPVAGVTLSLKGDRVYSGQSAANGIYSVAGAETGNYVLTPAKSDEIKGITAFDASLVLQHDAGLIKLTGAAAIAADVNRSGSITSFDAFFISQKAVDLITVPFPGAGMVWDFTPATRVYSNLKAHQTGQDFSAILLGDVSGNWLQPAQQQTQNIQGSGGETSGTTEPVVASVRRQMAPGSNIAIDWLLVKASRPTIYSIDVVLGYDASAGNLKSIQPGPQAEAFLISMQTNQPGILRAAISGAVPMQGIASVLGLGMPMISGIPTRIIEIVLNEGTVPVRIDATSASFDHDSDGDRQSDWLEILAGTNPQDVKSFFGISEVRSNLDRSKTISWTSALGKKYRVESKNSVAAFEWTAAHDEIATREITTYTDQTTSGTSQRIYRVRILE